MSGDASRDRTCTHEGGFTVGTRRDGTRFFTRRPVEVEGAKFDQRGNPKVDENDTSGKVKEPSAVYVVKSAQLCELGVSKNLSCVPGVQW